MPPCSWSEGSIGASSPPIRGPLYRIFTGEAYVAMALLALLGAGSAFLLMRRWHGGLVVAGHHPHRPDVGGAIIPPS